MKSHAQVVIIGGGITGCSLLYHLTELGCTDVVLVEKNELTAGSTWHAAGLCTHFGHSPTIMHMRAHSVAKYKEFDDVDFHPSGAMRITAADDRMDEFRHVKDVGRIAGFDFHILTPSEIKDLYPLCQTDGLIGGIYEPLDGHVDPSQATHAFAKRARAAGAEIYRQNPVVDLKQHEDGSWDVVTQNGTIQAETIVNCAGTWCREIGDMMGIDLPVVPMLHQYLVTEGIADVDALDKELPIFRDPDESWYTRQERDGLILGPYERPAVPWSIDGVPPEFGMDLLPPDLDRIEDIIGFAMNRVPALKHAGIKTVVNGPITFTPDANALIGPAYGLRNAWLLTGTSMGVMEGGGAGKLLAEWMVDDAPSMDVLGVDSRRFGAYADRDYRIAKATECFEHQFAIHYPNEERLAARDCIKSPTYDRQKELGAQFGFVYGWERANWFATDKTPGEQCLSWRRTNWFDATAEECQAVANGVGLFEVSAFSKYDVAGANAFAALDGLGSNAPAKNDGGITLNYALTPQGGVYSEFTVTRLSRDRFYLVSAAGARRRDHDLLNTVIGHRGDVTIEDITEQYGVLALAGPKSREVLSALTDADLSNDEFPWLTAQEIVVAGCRVRALRVSYVGELGWELHHRIDDQAALYDALLDAGSACGIRACGAYAMNALRLEKGYRAWGLDLSTEKTPLEAGLHPFVKFEGRGFTGKEAMQERNRAAPGWRMVLMALDGTDTDVFGLHPVMMGDDLVGITTSGAYGHRVGMSLALAYLQRGIDLDAPMSVNVLGNAIPATALDRIPYDPTNTRMRS
ncbi:MAG: FAD-dependent oxidoreductase [Rhodospirillales bacterium]|jgi:dimethylglycine dehydrogenase|nr:FAD-dependent oxidoreductase [Rhodospirillales bacterium]MBT4041496.1 FAD-dependent oxidoreductase [Rhodospirillales bacterium]MBT4627501.1 FAD-dependent oxidoreductase [Rhodospirillales bacterium]MBT5351001.1 FAD-dependent oxidoreductase [Rhodospirillales bacterium]MBT5520944.1 FAD-dependent oxidoreductase [Rhodospirillales bacterium]